MSTNDYYPDKPEPECCEGCGRIVIDNGEHIQLPDKSLLCEECVQKCTHPRQDRDDHYCLSCGQDISEHLVAEAESRMENR